MIPGELILQGKNTTLSFQVASFTAINLRITLIFNFF